MKKYLLISIFVLYSVHLFADNYYGKKIGIENGLSQASVTSITYNENGALWIGTRFGLNEYSNGEIKQFLNDKECGLQGCYINGLFCDSHSNLWVSNEKGLFLYDNHTGVFQQISNDATNCTLEYNDTLFVGGHKGLLHYDNTIGRITGEESPVWTDILNLHPYKDSLLCIDRRNGISLYNRGEKTELEIAELKGHTLMASYLDRDTLYLSILGEGLLLYDISRRKVCFTTKGEHNELAIILSISKINNDIWIGSDGEGIWILDHTDNSITPFSDRYSTNPGTEIPKAVTCIYQDPLGNIWLGGERFGLVGLKSSSIRSFLTDKIINYLYYSESKKVLYVGTNGEGIFAYSENFSDCRHLTGTEGLKITTIADYDESSLILCAYNKGFYIYDLKGKTIKPFLIIDKETNSKECLFGNAPEVYRLPDGRLLLYALHNYIYSTEKHTFTKLKDKAEEYAADLKAIYASGTSDIYTFSKEGIFKVDVVSEKIERKLSYNTQIGYINCIAYDDKNFAFGTDYGLYKLNTSNFSFSKIDSPLFSRVTELRYDLFGRLWVGADNTLFIYEDNEFFPVSENKGVAANEIHESAITKSGLMFFAGSNGFLAFNEDDDNYPIEIKSNQISLNEVELDGRAVNVSNGTLTIPQKSKNLNVVISLKNADPLEKIVYRYMVSGTSSYSIETFGEKFSVPIQKAGNYKIMVSYLKGKGDWSSPQTVLNFKKKKPWYISNTALLFYIIIFTLAITGLILYIKHKMLLKLQSDLSQKDHSFIVKFEAFVKEHLGENELNVEQIATELAMSRASLYTKVKASFGKGVGEYIEEQRMEEAKHLLSSTNLSVAEIAEHVGYSTPRYFSSRFKVFTGDSPLSYRKRI